jgi:hypothetical protein
MLLPMFWLETLDGLLNRRKILFVNEVSTVTATTLLQFSCVVVEHPLAARAINARPIRKHERGINHPCLLGIRVGETDPFMKFFGS